MLFGFNRKTDDQVKYINSGTSIIIIYGLMQCVSD